MQSAAAMKKAGMKPARKAADQALPMSWQRRNL